MNDETRQKFYLIVDKMRNMATIGRHFAKDPYEIERMETVMDLAVEIAALIDDDNTPDQIREFFWQEPWSRLSPAIGVDAFVLNEREEVLLIQRADNQKWALPGGLSEVGDTPAETAIKELWEEAGLRGTTQRLLGMFDNRIWGRRAKVHAMALVYLVACDDLTPNLGIECIDYGFFAAEALPDELFVGHDKRVPACFKALHGDTYFDMAAAERMELNHHQRPE